MSLPCFLSFHGLVFQAHGLFDCCQLMLRQFTPSGLYKAFKRLIRHQGVDEAAVKCRGRPLCSVESDAP